MNFAPNEEQELVRRTARDVAEKLLAPRAAARDVSGEFPAAELRRLAQLGLFGVAVPEALGGAGMGAIAYSLAMQELARGDASVSVAVSVTNMVGELIAKIGTDEQKTRLVPELCSGRAVCGAFALSEPQAGSDPAGMRTTARREGDGWRLDGSKQWITSGDRAGCIVVWAVTDPNVGHKGITAFLVKGGTPGLSVGRLEEKMGLHGSTTAQLVLDGVVVGDDAKLPRRRPSPISGELAQAPRAIQRAAWS